MSSLREIKERISSVRSTLKITSSMKLVASAKLRKAQKELAGMVEYEKTLQDIISCVPGVAALGGNEEKKGKVAIVAFASNSSLCGGFNASIAKLLVKQYEQYPDAELILLGKKLPGGKFSDLMAHPSYDEASALADSLVSKFRSGEYSKVFIVYSHYVSTSTQRPTVDLLLPFKSEGNAVEEGAYLYEPEPQEIIDSVLDQIFRLKVYTVVLDTVTSEHAARTLSMQMASDNAQGLLDELSLEYNKGRQQKITAEILDIIGGTQK